MPMAPARSDTEVPSKPFAQKSRIAVASASCVQNSRGRPLRALWSAPAIRPGQSAASCRNPVGDIDDLGLRSEEHTSELQSLMRISYAVFCLKKKKIKQQKKTND